MPTATNLAAFALVALAMVLTPGPNMIYLVSRSICQGRVAGLISLVGVAAGFAFYMVCAALGLTALLFAVPFAYDAIRFAGAAYLGWLAWQALRPGGKSAFEVSDLPPDSPARLFTMGLVTNLLNPKAAVMYLSLFPQFIEPPTVPGAGSVLAQSLVLGGMQIAISMAMNTMIIFTAAGLAGFLATRPGVAALQQRLMGVVLAGLAIRLATEARR